MVGDLPRNVAYQWRRWCLDPDYVLGEGDGERAGEDAKAAYARFAAPILSYSFDDDVLITKAAIDALHGFYREARVTRRHVAPAAIGAKQIGHFGFFSERAAALWKETLEWLRAEMAAA